MCVGIQDGNVHYDDNVQFITKMFVVIHDDNAQLITKMCVVVQDDNVHYEYIKNV